MEANLVGKMVFIAPELITSVKYSYSADYWSIGMVLYEVITGLRPFVPHLPLAQWVLRVRDKKSDHITIFEDNNGEFIYSNKIYSENQLSSKFAMLLENWFKLALEWHPKQRGCVFETPKPIESENSSEMPPVQVLKFFQNADDILAKKILTIFVLTNHKLLSMEIDENTTNEEFTAFIERETSIPISKCHIILPKENPTTQAEYQFTKPIDLYIDGCFDKPMVFATQIDEFNSNALSATGAKKTEEIVAADVPTSVQNVLSNAHEQRLKVHSLRKFASDTLYFVRNENKKYKLCLDGWFYFAQQLSHCIDTCQQHVKQMQTTVYGVYGALELFKQTLEMAKEKSIGLDVSWLDQHSKITQHIELLVNACDKITVRFGSAYRRCRESFQNDLFVKRNTQDFYDIINVTKAYDVLCKQISNNNTPPKPHLELFQCAYKCLKQRDHLLRNEAFVEMQRYLLCHNLWPIRNSKLHKIILSSSF